MACPEFTVDERNREFMNELFLYLIKGSEKLDSNKGLLLYGPVGTGKSTILKIIQLYDRYSNGKDETGYYLSGGFPIESATFISNQYTRKGVDGISKYDGLNGIALGIDEVGKEPKDKGKAPCMIIFCEFEDQFRYIELGKRYGLNNYINLVFRKDFSAQVLKANMKVVGNCEYGLLLYREKLPKFNNDGRMIFNCFDWVRDNETPKVHPTQKPVPLLRRLIEIFTDKGDVVIDPCAGSGSTLLAAAQLGRKAYGFEIKKDFYSNANRLILSRVQQALFQ